MGAALVLELTRIAAYRELTSAEGSSILQLFLGVALRPRFISYLRAKASYNFQLISRASRPSVKCMRQCDPSQ